MGRGDHVGILISYQSLQTYIMTNRWLLEKLKKLSEEELDEDFDRRQWTARHCREVIPPGKWT